MICIQVSLFIEVFILTFGSSVITSKQHGRARYPRPNKNDVRGVVIHHMAGYFQGGLSQGLTGPYVAHFYIGDKQCVEVIPAEQQGYHAANSYYNNYFVGIEHANISLAPSWSVAEDTIERSARLMADLSRYYKWGKFELGKNVVTHTGVSQSGTACPGPFMLKNLNRLINRANQLLGAGGSSVKPDGSNLPINNNLKVGEFQTKVNVDTLNIRKEDSTKSEITGVIKDKGIYTIVKQKGAWGKLKSGKGWIYMHKNYCTPVSRGPSPSIYSSPKGILYKITGQVVNVRKEPSVQSKIAEQVKKGEQYTIVEIKEQGGYKWGKLKSGVGWIALNFAVKQ